MKNPSCFSPLMLSMILLHASFGARSANYTGFGQVSRLFFGTRGQKHQDTIGASLEGFQTTVELEAMVFVQGGPYNS